MQSILRQDDFVRREDGTEWLTLDIGLLFGQSDDLVEDCDIYRSRLVVPRLANRAEHALSSVRGECSSSLLCSDGGDSEGIDSLDAQHASLVKA